MSAYATKTTKHQRENHLAHYRRIPCWSGEKFILFHSEHDKNGRSVTLNAPNNIVVSLFVPFLPTTSASSRAGRAVRCVACSPTLVRISAVKRHDCVCASRRAFIGILKQREVYLDALLQATDQSGDTACAVFGAFSLCGVNEAHKQRQQKLSSRC